MWQVQRLRETETEAQQLISFLNLCSNGWGNKSYWEWKYNKKPLLNLSSNIWFIKDETNVIGCYGYIPLKIKVEKDVIYGCQAVDGASHPAYRRKGIFCTLDKTSIRDASSEGTQIFYGLGTPEAVQAHIKHVNWQRWCKVLTLDRVLHCKRIGNTVIRRLFTGGMLPSILNPLFVPRRQRNSAEVVVKEITQFDSSITPLFRKASGKFDWIVERSPEYLNWRLSNPRKRYEIFVAIREASICGYIIARFDAENHRYVIEDYLCDGNGKTLDPLLHKVSMKAWEKGCISIRTTMTTNHPYRFRFFKNFFIPLRKSTEYICHYENALPKCQEVCKNVNSAVHLTGLDKNE